ncbi:MAG: hypothetical protein ACXVLF_13420 [Flavisolibacter sp.]
MKLRVPFPLLATVVFLHLRNYKNSGAFVFLVVIITLFALVNMAKKGNQKTSNSNQMSLPF